MDFNQTLQSQDHSNIVEDLLTYQIIYKNRNNKYS